MSNANFQGIANPITARFTQDSILQTPAADNYGSLMMQAVGQPLTEVTRRGRMFIYHTSTAAALLVSATTGLCPTIWNPPASGRALIVDKLRLVWQSGSVTTGSVLWAVSGNAAVVGTPNPITATKPADVGSGKGIVTFTNVAPVNALFGSSSVSSMYWAPATVTFTAAPPVQAATGIQFAATTTAAANFAPAEQIYHGEIQVLPGNALSLVYNVTTSTATFYVTIWAHEMDLPSSEGTA